MKRQHLEELSQQELENYKRSLLSRNDQLRSMVLVCKKENLNLKYRLQQLRHLEERKMGQEVRGFQKLLHLDSPHKLLAEKSSGVVSRVSRYTTPVFQRMKEGTVSISQSLAEKGSYIGGSIWSIGSSIKNKILGQSSESPDIRNINPEFLKPQQLPAPTQYYTAHSHSTPLELSPATQNNTNSGNVHPESYYEKTSLPSSLKTETRPLQPDDSEQPLSKETNSIIDKLDVVISEQF